MANVLVVEDNSALGDLLNTFISAAGHQVTLCAQSIRALESIRDRTWDLVVTDMFMPDRDGLDILRETRRLSPDTPVIAMSGGSTLLPSFDPLMCARELGAAAVLKKPFTRSELLREVNFALSSRRAPERSAGTKTSLLQAVS
ncbi:MAG: response regulator [Parvibaculum sp.]|uniref:response regulator n=1 Tax=Parvibaculum sp. TaxID=2024848 RepID=UPI0025E66D7C|nr:response regulator [Parvibaculum sp.]MCE9648430.1 response regulator [Parvibaculum sp.]